MDEMKKIVICRHCGRPDYWGQFRWLSGRCMCRACYRKDYEKRFNRLYEWDDLTGHVPTMEEYQKQEKERT